MEQATRWSLLSRYKGVGRREASRLLSKSLHADKSDLFDLLSQLRKLHLARKVRDRLFRLVCHRKRAALLTRLVRRKRNRPINTTDPITMDTLQQPLFRYVTPGSKPRVYAYNAESLVKYVVSSARFVDPLTGVPFSEVEVMRLSNLRQKLMPLFRADIDLQRLAFDEEYRFERQLMDALAELADERSRNTLTAMMDAFNPANTGMVIVRYVTMMAELLRTHLNSYSLLNPHDSAQFVEHMIEQLRANQLCPPRLLQWAENVRTSLQRRNEQGWHAGLRQHEEDEPEMTENETENLSEN